MWQTLRHKGIRSSANSQWNWSQIPCEETLSNLALVSKNKQSENMAPSAWKRDRKVLVTWNSKNFVTALYSHQNIFWAHVAFLCIFWYFSAYWRSLETKCMKLSCQGISACLPTLQKSYGQFDISLSHDTLLHANAMYSLVNRCVWCIEVMLYAYAVTCHMLLCCNVMSGVLHNSLSVLHMHHVLWMCSCHMKPNHYFFFYYWCL